MLVVMTMMVVVMVTVVVVMVVLVMVVILVARGASGWGCPAQLVPWTEVGGRMGESGVGGVRAGNSSCPRLRLQRTCSLEGLRAGDEAPCGAPGWEG